MYVFVNIEMHPIQSVQCYSYVDDFRADHLVLENHLKALPWGRLFFLFLASSVAHSSLR